MSNQDQNTPQQTVQKQPETKKTQGQAENTVVQNTSVPADTSSTADSQDNTQQPKTSETPQEKPQAPAQETASQPQQPNQTQDPTPAEPEKDTKQELIESEDKNGSSGPKAYWYVVHTYSGHEGKVAATLKQRVESQKLQEKILDILVPTQEKIKIKEGKKSKIKE